MKPSDALVALALAALGALSFYAYITGQMPESRQIAMGLKPRKDGIRHG